ncbi:MAG: molybdate ABC transporter substrate-binding protein [Janthinobacterium lividum]
MLLTPIFAPILVPVLVPSRAAAQSTPSPRDLHIAAAADLQPVLPTLALDYEKQTGVHIVPSFGSSATLTQQLQNGAPQDLFLSADCVHPQQLADGRLTADPQPTLYARGVLVLWARKDSPAQPLSLTSLSSPRVAHVAVANDLHAPYGQAATAAIHALHLQNSLAGKLVTGENIMQTAQFAQTGNAQAAFISLTIASSPQFRDTGTFIRLPLVYPEIRQCGVALAHAPHVTEAQAFLRWLTSAAVQNRLSSFGLDPAR